MSEPQGFITEEDYIPLKKLYEQAVKEGKTEFKYRGWDVLVAYAKYLLQYMDSRRG